MNDLRKIVNPRIFNVPDYDQGHITECWENLKIHRLMSNEGCYPPILAVQKAIKSIAANANYYPEDPSYSFSLRSKLADYSSVSLENITLGNGSIEILDLLLEVFLSEPYVDECTLIQPDYSAYEPRLTFFGWDINKIICGEDIKQTAFKILQNYTPKTKLILFSRPNNPMGTLIPKKHVEMLLETGCILVVDEAYIEFASPGESVSSWVKDWDNLIVTRTFSKAFCLAGIRLGYIIAHPQIIQFINRAKHIFNVNIAAMAAGEAAMDHLEEYTGRFLRITKTRDRLIDDINQIPGLKAFESSGNFVMINTHQSGIHAREYVNYLLEKNYYVRDFSCKEGLQPDAFFRISVGKQSDMKAVVNHIKSFVNKNA